eukprot:gnl/TRDRNA2_/TRDRNA2_164335_c0_seq8.p1 gnl/TRDRNA2_/TRDRNA2_164335_c0~~gnl/TRDRNA2_/TRDRNA2_164335_c0_seq8.p1  ORF type:complete len:706 (-),score=287.50 gnl/TRDRNA2_/TRDRNA2_164335_c0_seq8:75-2192(-)
MQCTVLCLLLFATSASAGSSGHPIQKVVTLLQDLAADVESEGKDEAVAFSKFEYWCKNSVKSLKKAIEDNTLTKSTLEDKIDAKTKEKKTLEEEIEALEKEIADYQASAKKAKAQRKKDNERYEDAKKNIEDTIQAEKDVLKAMKESQASALVQMKQVLGMPLMLEQLSDEDRDALVDYAAKPKAKKYNFKGGNIIELMKQLEMKFEDDLTELEKEETNSINAYNLAKKARDNALDAADDSKDAKESLLSEVKTDLEGAKGDLKDTEEELDADTTSLEDTEKTCATKRDEWNERSAVRKGELDAIAAAIKIMEKVSGVRAEKPEHQDAPESPLSFMQLAKVQADDPKQQALGLIREAAKKAKSKQLERLAQQISAHLTGPFDQVNQMIQKMVFRLMAEQKDEDDHKSWCDIELEKSEKSKEKKEDTISLISDKLEEAEATVQELTEDISEATKMMAEITEHVKEYTEMREEAKAENKRAIKDASDAQNALANAISVLEEHYKESGMMDKDEWGFVQRGKKGVDLPEQPSTWDSGYTGVSDPNAQPGGIITVLKETSADFAKMEADTRAQEEMDEKDYQDEMKASAMEKSKRQKESDMKEAQKKRTLDKITAMESAKKHQSQELDAVKKYLEDLQPACVEGDSTYEDRKDARDSEIKALKKAQKILEGAFKEDASASFLSKKKPEVIKAAEQPQVLPHLFALAAKQ